MHSPKPLLSIVIPVFNEESTIGKVIGRLRSTLKRISLPYEILVVDDCSADRSREVSRRQKVKVYPLKWHMGKGYALRVGFEKAKGEIIVTMDSDGSHLPEEISRLLEPILKNEADLVVGSRFLEGRNLGFRRINKLGNRLLNLLITVITREKISDSQSGYRAIKSTRLKELTLTSKEYEIESEMLVKAIRKGFRIKEVPIHFEQRTYGTSRLDPVVDGIKIVLSTLLALKG